MVITQSVLLVTVGVIAVVAAACIGLLVIRIRDCRRDQEIESMKENLKEAQAECFHFLSERIDW
jgi:hypothetical protein